MRLLLDHNLSPKVALPLRAAGHDVTVAREVGLSSASGEVVIATAWHERRVLVGVTTPSFLLLRRAANRRPDEQATLILDNLDAVAADLDAGAIVVLGETTIRIRRLPIGDDT